jgi:2-polyprenyl-6-methoxyphenol hydroxylase-like FAD-dependent oxidoreductase
MNPTTDVLVVGAGPTGLTLAADLLRRGMRVRLVDAAPAPATTSRATSVTPRTLEVLDDLGIADELVAAGIPITATDAYAGDAPAFRLSFPRTDETRFPYLLNVSQQRTEQALTGLVESLGGRIERGRPLLGFRQERTGVVATVGGPDGVEEVGAAWLVGTDGGRSTVRRTLGVPFRGPRGGVQETIVLADVLLDRDLPADRIHTWFNGDGALLAFPFPEPHRWRVTAALSPQEEAIGGFTDESLDRFTALYRRRTGDDRTRLTDMVGFSVYRVNQRVVDHFRRGRVLLAGDAAHVHTPAGGLGMNTGVQDAYALGWRLAAAVQEGDGDGGDVVDGYERERRPVAEALLTGTGGLQKLYSIRDRRVQRARDSALQGLLGLPALQRTFFRRAAQLDVGYRAPRDRWRRGVLPGDRAPDAPVLTWPDRTPARLHDLLRGTDPVRLDFGPRPGDAGAVRSVLVTRDGQDLPPRGPAAAPGRTVVLDPDGTVRRRYGSVGTVLVRPDGHIAAVHRTG